MNYAVNIKQEPLDIKVEPHLSAYESLNTEFQFDFAVKEENTTQHVHLKQDLHYDTEYVDNNVYNNINGLFECLICHKLFIGKDALTYHISLHNRGNDCTVCFKPNRSPYCLTEHMRSHTGEKPYACDICPYRATRNANLTAHKRTHTGEKPYGCDKCQYRTTSRSSVIRHIQHKHTLEKPYGCDICQYKTTTKSNLAVHVRSHTGDKPYGCDICQYRTTTTHNLTVHMRSHTEKKTYKCNVCLNSCISKSDLILHLRTHLGDKPYECDICHKRFYKKKNFKVHMCLHTEERLHGCYICQYKTTCMTNLIIHMGTHRVDKWYGCDFCYKRYNRANHPAAHEQTSEIYENKKKIQVEATEAIKKAYFAIFSTSSKCDKCHEPFVQKINHSEHKCIQTGEMIYECHSCHKRYSQNDQLKAHARIYAYAIREKQRKMQVAAKVAIKKAYFALVQQRNLQK